MRTKFQQPACVPRGPTVDQRAEHGSPGASQPLAPDPRAFCPSRSSALSQPVSRTSAVPVFILGVPSPSPLTLMSFPGNPSASSYFLSPALPCPPGSEDPGPGAACLETSSPFPPLCCGHWALGPQRTLHPLLFGFGPSHCSDQDLEWELTPPHRSLPLPPPEANQE